MAVVCAGRAPPGLNESSLSRTAAGAPSSRSLCLAVRSTFSRSSPRPLIYSDSSRLLVPMAAVVQRGPLPAVGRSRLELFARPGGVARRCTIPQSRHVQPDATRLLSLPVETPRRLPEASRWTSGPDASRQSILLVDGSFYPEQSSVTRRTSRARIAVASSVPLRLLIMLSNTMGYCSWIVT